MASVLKHSIHGDVNLASVEDVEILMYDGSGKIFIEINVLIYVNLIILIYKNKYFNYIEINDLIEYIKIFQYNCR